MRYMRDLIFGIAVLAILLLIVPAPAFAQDDETDATDLPTGTISGVNAQSFADRFDSLKVSWDEFEPSLTQEEAAGDPIAGHFSQGPITGYRIYYSKALADVQAGGIANASHVDVSGGDTESATISGLKPATGYFVSVAARNAEGLGLTPTANETAETTEAAPLPDRVTGVMLEGGDRSLMVSWTAPYAGHASLSIKSYKVEYSEEDSDDPDDWTAVAGASSMNTVLISNLEANTEYFVRVSAKNEYVTGKTSVPVNATTDAEITTPPEDLMPGQVMNVMYEPGPGVGVVTVTWDAPSAGGANLSITSYTVRHRLTGSSEDTWMSSMVTANTATISALMGNRPYDIQVQATNSVGTNGPWSGSLVALVPEGVPALPFLGAVALGAGLLAAGRRQLRKQHALRGSRVPPQLTD